jgi:hypothetical protein
MLMITENTILLEFQKLTICLIFSSQRVVKAWILVSKNASEIFVFPEKE